MILVTTAGSGSMDLYATELAARLPRVRKLPTNVYERSVRRFNAPLLSSTAARALFLDIGFIRALRREQEPIHFPNHHLGRYGRFLTGPYMITVHDLIRYFDLRRMVPFIHSPNLRDRVCLALDYSGIKRATAIIAVSHTTKADLVEHLGIPESKIHVVYEGVDSTRFRPVEARLFEFPYVLYVGSEQPRKNLAILIEAFARLKHSGNHPDLRFVKVGAPGGRESDFRAQTERLLSRHGVRDSAVIVDRVHADVLPAYYAGAECTVLASLYEGFGLPILEAMACGSPVVASSGGSIPEIAGDAALLVSPRDPTSLAEAIDRVLCDRPLRDVLQIRGIRRASEFTWHRTATETEQVYEMVERDLTGPSPLMGRPALAATGAAAGR